MRTALLLAVAVILFPTAVGAEPGPELPTAKEFFETAGLPGDRWVEGETMVPYVVPASHFKPTLLYSPRTEEVQANEVRYRAHRRAQDEDDGLAPGQ